MAVTSRSTAVASRFSAATKTNVASAPLKKASAQLPAKTKQADPIGTATVTCNSLNVRSGAGTNYGRIGGLTKGQSVGVYEEKDGWLKIKYNSDYGWISKAYTSYKANGSGTTTDPETNTFEPFQAKVSGVGALYVRKGPSKDYDTITSFSEGTVVTVVGQDPTTGWYQIECNGVSGWMSNKYLEKVTGGSTPPVNPPATEGYEVVISVNNYLNVRTGPGTSYESIDQLHNQDKATVIEEKSGWYHIKYGNGKEGWISSDYCYKPGEASEAGKTAADKARALMAQYVSEKWTYSQDYRSSTGHYDCSYFTHRCWLAAGVNFNGTTAAGQAEKCANAGGEIKSKADIQPGDLLFWSYKTNGRYRNISHVAIAIGGGRRIDAGGTPVREDSVGSPLMIGRPSVLLKK